MSPSLVQSNTPATFQAFYQVEVAPKLDTALVRIQASSDEPMPRWLYASASRSSDLKQAQTCDGRNWRKPSAGSGWRLPDEARCVQYRVALRHVAGRASTLRASDWLLTSPQQWLWLPRLRGSQVVRLSLRTPDGVERSVPWEPLAAKGGYRIPASPQSGTPLVLFGKLNRFELSVESARLRVAAPGMNQGNVVRLRRWLARSAGAVAAVAGQFPVDDLQVMVLSSTSDDGSAVPFGHVIRNQGVAIRFFVDPRASADDLHKDWTANHEFSHLLLPYVTDKWLSEGVASYYQNVLQARTGAYTEKEMWRRLTRSFQRAADIANPPVAQELHNRSFWEVRMLVYWLGAALALQADVELRRVSAGHESLDKLLGKLHGCCDPVLKSWSARKLMDRLDELSDFDLLSPLLAHVASKEGMPDLRPLLRQLGVERLDGKVSFNDDAPLASLRRQITQPIPIAN